MYVSNHFNHCIKLFAPCGPLIGNKKFLFLFLFYKVKIEHGGVRVVSHFYTVLYNRKSKHNINGKANVLYVLIYIPLDRLYYRRTVVNSAISVVIISLQSVYLFLVLIQL